jgi:hypothetical protein
MKLDWGLIGATAGLAACLAVLGAGAIVVLRAGPEEVRKAPPTPLLWSSRRTDAAADLQVFAASGGAMVTDARPLAPARERPATSYELFPASTEASAAPVAAPPRKPRVEPIVAKPAPEPKTPTHVAMAPAAAAAKPSVHPQAPGAAPKIVDHRYDGVLTMAEIARLKTSLQLTPDQEPLWRPLEAELRKIGRMQMALVHSGQKPEIPQSEHQPIYQAAMPLFATLRPDQKERVRIIARRMGYGSVASMI